MKDHTTHHSLQDITAPHKGVLLDAYGVFWAGNAAGSIPGSKEAMQNLVQNGKIVGILSNSTRLASAEIEKLDRHKIHMGQHYHFLITSGEIIRTILLKQSLPFKPMNNHFFVLGGPYPTPGFHNEIFTGSIFAETDQLAHASFIYVSTPQIDGKDQTDPVVFVKNIENCKEYNLPMICANPDLFAHEGNPPQAVVRQGSLAKYYESLGGKVFYIGKPYAEAYSCAMQAFSHYHIKCPSDIIMIGDTPETDVRGAKNFGMQAALITETGIMADRIKEHPKSLHSELLQNDIPDFYLRRLAL
jgi:HAD superfamily hydrolase (TIGR01459 family)